MTTYAYLRVSTDNKGQTTENQRKKIVDAGFHVDEWFSEDGVSGSVKALERPAFAAMKERCTEGDTVIVTMLDRLGRNAMDILNTVEAFKATGVKLRVMQLDGTDLTSGVGMLVLMVMSAMAQIEREEIVDRITQGIARTRAQGTKFGAPFKVSPRQLAMLTKAVREDKCSLSSLQKETNIPRATISNIVKEWGDKQEEYAVEYAVRAEQQKKNKEKRAKA